MSLQRLNEADELMFAVVPPPSICFEFFRYRTLAVAVFRYMTTALTEDSPCVTGILSHIRCSFIRIYSNLLRATTSWIEPLYQTGQVEGNKRCSDMIHAMFLIDSCLTLCLIGTVFLFSNM